MNITEEIIYSDNSHIFGYPCLIKEELSGYLKCPRSEAREILDKANLDLHITFVSDRT